MPRDFAKRFRPGHSEQAQTAWNTQNQVAQQLNERFSVGATQTMRPHTASGAALGAWSLELGCAVMLIPFQEVEEQGQPGWRSRRRVTAIGSWMTQTQSQYHCDKLANR